MEKKVIDQKGYLKKYLSSGDGDDKKKKKKKRMKLGAKTVKIIDDDIDLKNMRPVEENEFDIFIDGEDAPQIAGVVDERGPVDFSDKKRWKIVADDEGGDLTISSTTNEPKRSKQVQNISDDDLNLPRKQKKYSDDDISPPRVSKKQKNKNNKKLRRDEDSDLSPPRIKSKKHKTIYSNADNDNSQETDTPPHKVKERAKRKEKTYDSDLSSPRRIKNYDSDLSPPRKSRKESDSDLSPLRRNRKRSDSDVSIPRQNRKDADSDLSLSRNKNYDLNLSLLKKSKKHKNKTRDSDSDLSPPRKKYDNEVNVYINSKFNDRNDESSFKRQKDPYLEARRNRNDNLSPIRQHEYRDEKIEKYRNHKQFEKYSKSNMRHYDSDVNLSYKNRDVDTDPSRFKKNDRDSYKSKSSKINNRYNNDPKSHLHRERSHTKRTNSKYEDSDQEHNEKRMKKTLDGKKAGLQDAKALREETEAYKKQEAKHFSKLSKEVTGVGQAAVVRDTRTGKKRNLEAEAKEEREKQKRQAELDEKYAKWGKGLKQVEDREEKLKDDLYEMSKPLARYADDADLDKRLREQEREGDPMLEYIKQKQIKEGKRKPERKIYEGSYMPNRFGIKPGHRWDGVDRSNGYEKRWFEAQNAKVARQEEAYKWSTSDM